MKKLIILSIFFTYGCSGNQTVFAQNDKELFTIYLVRHSEKDLSTNNFSDPPLSECGNQRSIHLSQFLKNINIDVIYTTDYNRTKQTALPTAVSKELELVLYNPSELNNFSKQLLSLKQNALVVGHSNTTAVLAGLLTNQEMGAFEESVYNRIYEVLIFKDYSKLNLIFSSFECEN